MLGLVVSCVKDITQQVEDNDSGLYGHPENGDANESSLPSRGRAPSMQVSDDGLDRPSRLQH